MQEVTAKIQEFVHFVDKHIKGDEKGQAQVFCDRLFQAFGHAGVFESGGDTVAVRELRRKVMAVNGWSLRDLYRTLDLPGKNPLRDLQDALDGAVRSAYGIKPQADPLAFLLDLNHQLAGKEKAGTAIVGPGLPPCVQGPASFITEDCVQPPML
jgi:hypothetical protein